MSRASALTCVCGLVAAVIVSGATAWAQFPAPRAQQSPQPGQPAVPQPAADPRVERVSAELRRRGFQVLEIEFVPARGKNPPFWRVTTQAQYAQPARNPVLRQAFGIWDVVFAAASRDLPNTGMFVVQAWDKYLIGFITSVHDYRELVNDYGSAGSPEEKEQVIEEFLLSIEFWVYDVERNRRADKQDFINKYLTR